MRMYMTRLLDAKENRLLPNKLQFEERQVTVKPDSAAVIVGIIEEDDRALLDAVLNSARLELLHNGWMLFSGFERDDKTRRWRRQEWLFASPDIMIDAPDSLDPKPDAPFPSEVT